MIDIGGALARSNGATRPDRPREPDPTAAASPRPNGTIRWAINGVYAILLVIMALVPSTSSIAELSPPDWLAHSLAYGLQAALLYWACLPWLGRNRAMLCGVVGASGFGFVTEALQLLQPSRAVELKDLAANTVGAVIVCGLIVAAAHLAERRVG